jgi:hypothetical protein
MNEQTISLNKMSLSRGSGGHINPGAGTLTGQGLSLPGTWELHSLTERAGIATRIERAGFPTSLSLEKQSRD